MIRFSHDVVIQRPIEPVFGFVTDLRNLPLWLKSAGCVEKVTPGPPALTDEFLLQIHLWGPLHIWQMLQIAELQPYTFARFQHDDSLLTYELVCWFTRLENGRTKFTLKAKIQPRGVLNPPIALVARRLEAQLVTSLPLLKAGLEQFPHQY